MDHATTKDAPLHQKVVVVDSAQDFYKEAQMVKVKVVVAILAGVTMSLGVGLWFRSGPSEEDKLEKFERVYADDPAVLYQAVGIKQCGGAFRHKMEKTRGVLIDAEDLARAMPMLKEGFRREDITAALYTNAPEATAEMRGQPALIPLRKEGDRYCALGLAGSYSTQIFLELEAKYQAQLK